MRDFARLRQSMVDSQIRAEDKVLDGGGATGYSATLLGRLAASIVALEEDAGLAATAAKLLAELGAENVRVVTGPLNAGRPPAGPHYPTLLHGPGGSATR